MQPINFQMNDFNTKEERELIEECIQGKSNAHERFFKKYYSLMLGICLRYCNNKSDARDVLQEGFIKVFNNLASFKFEAPLIAWMKRVFINTAIDKYRKDQQFPKFSDISEQINLKADNDNILSQMATEDILKCINKMPVGYRTVFNLYAIEGYTHKEIADKLGITEGTSKSQFAKSKKYLRNLIEKQSF